MCVQIWTCKHVCAFEKTEQMMRSDDWMRRAEPDGTFSYLALIRTWYVLFFGAGTFSTRLYESIGTKCSFQTEAAPHFLVEIATLRSQFR